jgi:ribosomal protein S18 acetylase RimI-like enzyme
MTGRKEAAVAAGQAPLPEARYLDTEIDVAACYGLMRQLRPHLTSEHEFIERWRRQTTAGYRLLAICLGPTPLALAGYRVQENLVHGRHLYIDDLVTDEALRGSGHGGVLLERLKIEGRALGCDKLVLDSALNNALGHRFYYRQGLLAAALRFTMPLA